MAQEGKSICLASFTLAPANMNIGIQKMKRLFVFLFVPFVAGCVSMSPGGKQVRVVDKTNAEFVNECDFITAEDVSAFGTWWGTEGELEIQARDKAAKLGGNVIVMHSTGAQAVFDVYKCP